MFYCLTKYFLLANIIKHFSGAVAEWFKAAVLKTVVLQGTGGSNPPCSDSFKEKVRKGSVVER